MVDRINAACDTLLDDGDVDRFISELWSGMELIFVYNGKKYIVDYKDKTEFIIITHKKRTMEYANSLYGITMQESGVSKLVSVRLEDMKK